MGLELSSYLDTSRSRKANNNTGFTEDFALIRCSSSLKVALLNGGNAIHVAKKTGRGIQKLGEFLKWATIRRQNDQSFNNLDYDAEPAVGLSNVSVQQHKGHDVKADGTPQLHNGCHNL